MKSISVRPSRDIRTNYAEISKLCRERPVAVTVNGREDTVVMSHEQFLELQRELDEANAKLQFYTHLAQSEDDRKLGRIYPADEIFAELKADLDASRL